VIALCVAGLGKFSKGVWNPQGDTPQVVCENDDYFPKEEFYKDPKTGKQTRYRDALGKESFKYFGTRHVCQQAALPQADPMQTR